MKIITLNIWEGKITEALLKFIVTYKDVDVFMLQEVLHDATELTAWEGFENKKIFSNIKELLPEHNGYFAPSVFKEWGLAMFIKKDIVIEETGDIFVHKHCESMVGKDGSTIGRNIQYVRIFDKKPITLINFHGLWNGKGKTDTEDRLSQSRRILDFIKNISHDIVLGGDFNLLPNTNSLQIFEKEAGLKNLISDFGVTSTRTSHYTKSGKFADYVFVSPTVRVKDFRVMKEEVSDHSPLLLEI